MKIIDNKTVVVTNSEELKTALSGDNEYVYIYFGNDITLESGFVINSNKEKVIIDGTYQNHKYTYYNYLSENNDVIIANSDNKVITVKNLVIKSSHTLGVIYVSDNEIYENVKVVYSNIQFNGIKLSNNLYGTTKILDSSITIEDINNIKAQSVCDCNKIEIGGQTTFDTPNTAFLYQHTIEPSKFTILTNSKVNLNTLNAFFNGTPRLDFKILHNSEFNLTTGNGFAQTINNGCKNVLIDEYSTFNFIENNHQRIPMWNVYGDFIVNNYASLFIINSFDSTPADNYNIYFKGTNQNLILNNPKSIIIYTKNANILYTENPVNFSFEFNRLNMWINSKNITTAGSIDNLPDYSWYKVDTLSQVKGVFYKTTTTITETNYTEQEKNKLPDLSNFIFQNRKQFSIGMIKNNIHPIDSNSTKISGHTMPHTDVLISYDSIYEIVTSDVDGLFEYILLDDIQDGTNITIVFCKPTSFVYDTRLIVTPFEGEITLLNSTEVVTFDKIPISTNPIILGKKKNTTITVIDSRKNGTEFNLYLNYVNPMMTIDGKVLIDSLIFKKFDDEIITLRNEPKLIYQGKKTNNQVNIENITFSTDKGLLLRLDDDKYNLKDEFVTKFIWTIEL